MKAVHVIARKCLIFRQYWTTYSFWDPFHFLLVDLSGWVFFHGASHLALYHGHLQAYAIHPR